MIHKLLNFFKKSSIDYAVTNGYESLLNSSSTNKGDVDILFRKQVFLQIESILKEFCILNKYKIVQIYHQEVYAKNIFIYDPIGGELLNLDTYGKLHRKHTVFFSEIEIFNKLGTYKSISILATHHEFIYYLLKKIDKNQLSEASFGYLLNLYNKEKNVCEHTICGCFKRLSHIVIKAFNTEDFSKMSVNIQALKEDVVCHKKLGLSYFFKDQLRKVKRITQPTGITVCFLGPDGSGKSTLINALLNQSLAFRKTAYFHLKPIHTKKALNKTQASDPHKFKSYSLLKSYFKLVYFVCQYNTGWLKNIWALKVKSTLVIFDRYYDDLFIDSKRYRYGGSIKIARLVRLIIPKPELYFVLTAPADIIYSRKQEVDFTELQRQIELYKGLSQNKNYHQIDVNKAPKVIANEIYVILMKKMYERY